jgi:hypothetical protein
MLTATPFRDPYGRAPDSNSVAIPNLLLAGDPWTDLPGRT